jgi:hypothetical protein
MKAAERGWAGSGGVGRSCGAGVVQLTAERIIPDVDMLERHVTSRLIFLLSRATNGLRSEEKR